MSNLVDIMVKRNSKLEEENKKWKAGERKKDLAPVSFQGYHGLYHHQGNPANKASQI